MVNCLLVNKKNNNINNPFKTKVGTYRVVNPITQQLLVHRVTNIESTYTNI